jgi:hypothetical protein
LSDRAFEQRGGLAQFAPDTVEIRQTMTCEDEAVRVIERFRNPDRFLSVSRSLVEHSSLGEGGRQEGTGQYSGKHREAEALTDPIALE